MSSGKRKCKVCGKEYDYCHTNRKQSNVFRWQDVACCPEHGSIYFERIIESRKPKEEATKDDVDVGISQNETTKKRTRKKSIDTAEG